MLRLLHVVPRPDATRPEPFAEQLLEGGGPDRSVRVLELFDAPIGAQVVDLTLADRHAGELAAALHWADEVHAHGIDPRIILDNLPYVRPDALEATKLVLHGPWRTSTRTTTRTSARLGTWPGRWARTRQTDPDACPADATILDFPPLVDRQDPRLLPRALGPRPLRLQGDRYLAIVGVSADLGELDRQDLRRELSELSRPEVQIEVVDETETPANERAEARRVFQAFIVPACAPPHWRRTTLEALVQALPVVVLGPSIDDPPPGAVFVGESIAQAIVCVRTWTMRWAAGEAAPSAHDERMEWLDALLRAGSTRT
jgi:hypothetical protein